MTTRTKRNVVVTHSKTAVIVGLHWDEPPCQMADDRKHRFLVYPNGAILCSVNIAVDVLMRGNSSAVINKEMVIQEWSEFDQNPGLFDLIVDAEEPEQCLLSRYVLEA